ncbi:MAG: 50S ribosomal protein L3 [Patescibacteria group bacterium]
MNFILGRKLGMTQIFINGKIVPVTVVKAGPCFVTQIKAEKDGYTAVQIGFEKAKEKKSLKGKSYKHLREFRLDKTDFKVKDKIKVDSFKVDDKVKVSAISKGKGFQGVVKRHGFSGGPASHGHRHVLRAPGSIGSAFPEKVFKGKKMAGHFGHERVSVKSLKVISINEKSNLISIKGAVPGPINGLVEIKS